MMGFVTESGSIYYVRKDSFGQTWIKGGNMIKEEKPVTKVIAIIGEPAFLYMLTGEVIKTSPVKQYLSLATI